MVCLYIPRYESWRNRFWRIQLLCLFMLDGGVQAQPTYQQPLKAISMLEIQSRLQEEVIEQPRFFLNQVFVNFSQI